MNRLLLFPFRRVRYFRPLLATPRLQPPFNKPFILNDISQISRLNFSSSSKNFKSNDDSDDNLGFGLDDDEFDEEDLEIYDTITEMYDLRTYKGQVPQCAYIIHPLVGKVREPKDDLLMDEGVALVKTLGWSVAGKVATRVGRKNFFIENLPRIIKEIESCPRHVTVIFFSSYRMKPGQRVVLEEHFKLPVLDRYSLVLQIFRIHASSKEAKLQVDLAEIPYLFHRLNAESVEEFAKKHKTGRKKEDYFSRHKMNLHKREKMIRKRIEKIRIHRNAFRQQRIRQHLPSIAVVGYTNSGKTSLIRVLTGFEKCIPEDKLFATLDVTAHLGTLTSGVKTLFIDTVGFISDIPTALIASFSSTLEDAIFADLIIHVRDISHPDSENQNRNVLQTLSSLYDCPLDVIESKMIVVGNKMDNVDPSEWKIIKERENLIPISALEGYGIDYLEKKIDNKLSEVTGRWNQIYRVKTGSQEFNWLLKNFTVSQIVPDDKDLNYSFVHALITDIQFNQHKALSFQDK